MDTGGNANVKELLDEHCLAACRAGCPVVVGIDIYNLEAEA